MIILNNQLKIFMMQKDNDGRDLSDLNAKAKKQLTQAFNGLTITNAEGTWIDGDQLYIDKSYIYSCSYSGKLTATQTSAVIDVIKDELNKGKQQAVSIMLNGTLYILDAGDLDNFKEILSKR